jgi:hypothetical protein
MTKPSLTQLYRRFSGRIASVPDACEVLRGQDCQNSSPTEISPLHADLLRFSRDLEPATAQLSADLAAAFEQSSKNPVTHRTTTTPRRAAHAGSRRWRGVAALAASFVAVVAVWTTQHNNMSAQRGSVAIANSSEDRIFTALDQPAVASQVAGDQIFRGEFRSDEIFNSQSHGG